MDSHFCFGDMERTAELYNNGYQAAMQHQTGGAEHRAWLIQVAEQAIAHWVDTAYRITLAGMGKDDPGRKAVEEIRHLHLAEPWLPAVKIADALLSEIEMDAESYPDQ